MKHKKYPSHIQEFKDFLHNYWEKISYVFLGVGLTLFVINITSVFTNLNGEYNLFAFNTSVFLSILLIVYVVYSLTEK